MAAEWFYRTVTNDGNDFTTKEVGPVKSADLKLLARDGVIKHETQIRAGTDGKWVPARRVRGLIEAEELPVRLAPAITDPVISREFSLLEVSQSPSDRLIPGDAVPPRTGQSSPRPYATQGSVTWGQLKGKPWVWALAGIIGLILIVLPFSLRRNAPGRTDIGFKSSQQSSQPDRQIAKSQVDVTPPNVWSAELKTNLKNAEETAVEWV